MKLTVVKVGGHVIDDESSLEKFLRDFSEISGAKLLIHGGGKVASKIGKQLGIETQMHEGRRITDAATRDLVTMVYGGLLNKRIVSSLQALQVNALGLTGADGNLLKANKRPTKEVDFGFVGDITPEGVNVEFLESLLRMGVVPVIPALTHDGKGNILNTNADTMASVIAVAMHVQMSVVLCYCFEHLGVMRDMKNGIVISSLSEKETEALNRDGVIHSGMLPKLRNAFDAFSAGIKVRIGHFEHLKDIINENKEGTNIE